MTTYKNCTNHSEEWAGFAAPAEKPDKRPYALFLPLVIGLLAPLFVAASRSYLSCVVYRAGKITQMAYERAIRISRPVMNQRAILPLFPRIRGWDGRCSFDAAR